MMVEMQHDEQRTEMVDEGGPPIVVEVHGGMRLVTVAGEIDVDSVGRLHEAMSDALAGPPERVVVDLSLTTWIDSLGLGVLVAAWKRAQSGEVPFVLWRPSTKARAILKISALDQLIPVVDDLRPGPFDAA